MPHPAQGAAVSDADLGLSLPPPPLVLGVDSGFAHFGWCLARLLRSSIQPLAFGVISTEKDDAKGRTLDACDNFQRARRIADALLDAIDDKRGPGEAIRLVCYEAQSLPRNAGVSFKMGMGFGVLVAVCSGLCLDVPALEVSPIKLKKAACGSGTASKVDVGRALGERYGLDVPPEPNKRAKKAPPWTPLMGGGLAERSGEREHAWDALGAIHACAGSDLVRALRPAT